MGRRNGLSILLALALVLGVCTLMPLAYASPPDPPWVEGFFDNADYDDVVDMITSEACTVPALVLAELAPRVPPVEHVVQSSTSPLPPPPVAAVSSRAPPVR